MTALKISWDILEDYQRHQVTIVLYVYQVWLISSVVSNELLIYSKLVLKMMALPTRIVAKLGIVTSCIGAALQVSAALPPQSGD